MLKFAPGYLRTPDAFAPDSRRDVLIAGGVSGDKSLCAAWSRRGVSKEGGVPAGLNEAVVGLGVSAQVVEVLFAALGTAGEGIAIFGELDSG